ncbi:GntR family transcriptional regulator [Castellaniella sp. S9]|uniref:GntR family transcriptional regulator n=1 Tax=Castellaniella sp. S9 TaxID=2993652 RepID=UPI0022B4875B|nr:GntR family transcriptional regulator [Castellaniella sp. S9]
MNPLITASEQPASQTPPHERRPLSDEVYETLVTELISLRLPPGERLSVDALARQLGVSQTPIRAALIRLETEGLVVKKHNTGFSVAPLPAGKRFQEVYVLRSLLEPEAAALAADNARRDDVRKLQALCDKMEQLVTDDTEGNYGRFAMLDGQFHAHIALVGDNELLKHTLDTLHAHMHLFRLRYHASVAEEAVKEHLAILEGITKRDPDAARAAMATHIAASHERMKPCFQQLAG